MSSQEKKDNHHYGNIYLIQVWLTIRYSDSCICRVARNTLKCIVILRYTQKLKKSTLSLEYKNSGGLGCTFIGMLLDEPPYYKAHP